MRNPTSQYIPNLAALAKVRFALLKYREAAASLV
jgi:hypothetical protein